MLPAPQEQQFRSTITAVDGVLEITIPLRFRPLRFLFATVVCLIWGIAVPIGIWKLITDPSSRLSNYLVAALFTVVWVVSEPMLLHRWGTYLVGRDRVRVAVKEFGVRREIFGFGYWRRCPLKKVWEIQSVHNSMGGKAHLLALSDNRRFDFGHGLDASEADFLARELRETIAHASKHALT